MNRSTVANRWNLELIEANHQRWSDDPNSVDATWQAFFEGYELAQAGLGHAQPGSDGTPSHRPDEAQAAVTRLIDAYREVGHYLADLDPLGLAPPGDAGGLLDLGPYGLTDADLDRTFVARLFDPPQATAPRDHRRAPGNLLRQDRRRVHAHPEQRDPDLAPRPDGVDPGTGRSLDLRQKRRIILKLNAAELFETFLHTHYVGAKRFSLEGGETLIPLLDAIIERSAQHEVKEIVLGMPHRGRLNVLANTLDKPYGMIFGEFEDNQPETVARRRRREVPPRLFGRPPHRR